MAVQKTRGEMSYIKPVLNTITTLSAFVKESIEFILNHEGYTQIFTALNESLKDGEREEDVSGVGQDLENSKKTVLHIAITGETGTGKSSLINAIQGLHMEDSDAAPVGVTETTLQPNSYSHPNYPNVIFWDLPGVGSTEFPSAVYYEKVDLSCYDFFIIVASERFQSTEVDLAQMIQWMEKKFYYVRNKVDADLNNMKRAYPQKYNEEEILQQIKNNCRACMSCFKDSNRQVFLISTRNPGKYDFPELVKALQQDLPSLQSLAFLRRLPSFSPGIIAEKKVELKKLLWKISLVSIYNNASPIPGTPLACDVRFLQLFVVWFYKKFELDGTSLARLARWAEKPLEDLYAVIESPRVAEVTADLIVKKCVDYGNKVMEKTEPYFPPLTNSVRTLSFLIAKLMLSSFLDKLAEDAESVRKKVLGQEVQEV
ncbi:interferon-inducible GTPase 1-like isoform X1 [Varanus komodoensis]|uniref:interferon-inducible GTPase 1-like isoform X1 n=1 Tax=Varanus komodoensis TaxID=61221 RepID=UPI001CF770B9|nr:interferon-inducible GTPase 1-like isoform X1 [Varanus komodoensis]